MSRNVINIYAFIFLLLCSVNRVCALEVTFIVPDQKGPLFWDMVSEISKSTAHSLNIKFNVIYTASNRFALKNTIDKIIHSKQLPDYLIYRPFLGNTEAVFNQLEQAKIPFITLEQAFHGDMKLQLGEPQEKFKYWIGQMNYDNQAGGKLLLNALISAHQLKYPNEKIHIIGIGGDFDRVSADRQFALQQILEQPKENIVVEQIFPMYWNPTLIKDRLPLMKNRYPQTNIFWCGGDQMALELLRLHQMSSNKAIIVGGFDWLPQAIEKIAQGEFTASVGGHMLMVASALIKIIDLEQGINRFSSPALLNEYELIDKNNVKKYKQFIDERQWQAVDYNQFLRSKNPQAPTLNIKNILQLMKQNKATSLTAK
ncbi:ABC transporter substrate-binding protein [Thalassotalea sp. G2M2-11]|uniref:ABC transporter substrate-binding protein n=1 Tax=Thalassotalea sp. G2M2-11 TaxID=2787627 RepID=UPI0019D2DA68|nr:ABC transporter substrate-binding protein [Thalassotalea sp. G2M2-11]